MAILMVAWTLLLATLKMTILLVTQMAMSGACRINTVFPGNSQCRCQVSMCRHFGMPWRYKRLLMTILRSVNPMINMMEEMMENVMGDTIMSKMYGTKIAYWQLFHSYNIYWSRPLQSSWNDAWTLRQHVQPPEQHSEDHLAHPNDMQTHWFLKYGRYTYYHFIG